jgi:hypothetical protein
MGDDAELRLRRIEDDLGVGVAPHDRTGGVRRLERRHEARLERRLVDADGFAHGARLEHRRNRNRRRHARSLSTGAGADRLRREPPTGASYPKRSVAVKR